MQLPLALLESPAMGLVIVAIVVFLLLLWLGYARAPGIFGFGSHIVKTVETVEYASDDEEPDEPKKRSVTTERQSARTVWEWLTVLTISAVIGVAALLFSAGQAQQQRETQREQASDEAIQTYFDQMSALLIEEDLRTSPEDSEARTLARSRTLTILSRLDPQRRSGIFEFLLEAKLI
jgi:flagellar basal body-associated protein FliL